MLQDSSLFTPPGLELYAGDRMLAGKFSSFHCLFSCWFSSLLVPWLFSRLQGHQSTCLPGTHQQCLQAGHWPVVKLGGCLLSPGLDSSDTGLQTSWPSMLLTWMGLCTVFPLLHYSLGCVSRSSENNQRVYWQGGHQSGVAEWQGEIVFISNVLGHSPLFSLASCSAYILWPRVVVFLLSFVLISYWVGVEVTSCQDISYCCISAVALSMAPIAITTIRYPGESFQVLKFLRQVWLSYN